MTDKIIRPVDEISSTTKKTAHLLDITLGNTHHVQTNHTENKTKYTLTLSLSSNPNSEWTIFVHSLLSFQTHESSQWYCVVVFKSYFQFQKITNYFSRLQHLSIMYFVLSVQQK